MRSCPSCIPGQLSALWGCCPSLWVFPASSALWECPSPWAVTRALPVRFTLGSVLGPHLLSPSAGLAI